MRRKQVEDTESIISMYSANKTVLFRLLWRRGNFTDAERSGREALQMLEMQI